MFDPIFFKNILEISQNIDIEKCADYLTNDNPELRAYFENDLGIDTAAVTIANVADNKLHVLKNFHLQKILQSEDLNGFQFPEFSFSRKELLNENPKFLVDFLFLNLRKHQTLDKNPPEYYKYLQRNYVSELFKDNQLLVNLITTKKVAYIEAGEILIYLYAYRYYFREALKEFAETQITREEGDLGILSFIKHLAKEGIEHYRQLVQSYDEISLQIEELERKITELKSLQKPNIDQQKQIQINNLVKQLKDIKLHFFNLETLQYDNEGFCPSKEQEYLGLGISPNISSNTKILDNFINFNSSTGNSTLLGNVTSPLELHNILINEINIYFKTTNKSNLQILKEVHNSAAYPLPLYYYQIAFDKTHQCFDVMFIPIWSTNETIGTKLSKINHDNFNEGSLTEDQRSFLGTNIVVFGSFSLKPIEYLHPGTSCEEKCRFAAVNINNKQLPACIKNFKCKKQYFSYSSEDENFSNEFITRILKVQLIYRKLFEPIIDKVFYTEIIEKQLDSVKRQATKAAISQVMARNMSHNIGSHVMNKLVDSSYLENFCPNVCKEDSVSRISEICKEKKSLKSYNPDKEVDLSDNSPFSQITIYNNYIKCRMDYLSDMSFGTPLMQTSKYVYSDLYKELDKVRLLLENISGLSNFKYKITFLLNDKALNETNDFQVAIPNDVLGSQAFYNIIENVIRNTAKHAMKPDEVAWVTNFTINFKDIQGIGLHCDHAELIEESKQLIQVEIYDNIDLCNKGSVDINESENPEINQGIDYVIGKKGHDQMPDIKSLVEQQNEKLNQPILNAKDQLRASSLGLIEMKASASYLRKIDLDEIESEDYKIDFDDKIFNSKGKLNIIKAIKVSKGAECYFGYRFFTLKPQEVLIVTDYHVSLEKKDKLLKGGIWIRSSEDFIKHLSEKNGVFNHQFVLHQGLDEVMYRSVETDLEEKPILEFFKTSLPLRILKLSEVEVCRIPHMSIDEIINFCWTKWEKELQVKYQYSSYGLKNLPKIKGKIAKITDHLKASPGCTITTTWETLKRDSYYVEPASSKAQHCLPKYNVIIANSQEDKRYPLECYLLGLENSYEAKRKVAEAILTRILIIDERIQAVSLEDPLGVPQFDVNKMMRINGPDESINLSTNNFNESFNIMVKTFISENIEINDMILIHYSILERMFENSNSRLEKINEYLQSLSTKINVVITSGRGVPDKLPRAVRFINLSSIIQSFNEIKSKYLISYILNSSRKSNR